MTPWESDVLPEIQRHWTLRKGTWCIPLTCRSRGNSLSNSVRRLRKLKRLGRTTPACERYLERLPGWNWTLRRSRAESRMELLRRTVEKHGWDHVTPDLVIDGEPIGRWLMIAKSCLRHHHGTEKLLAQLKAIPGFSLALRLDEGGRLRHARAFTRNFALLESLLRKTSGVASRAARESHRNKLELVLGYFRMCRSRGRLTPEQRSKLRALLAGGFRTRGEELERKIQFLRRFARRHGGLPEITSSLVVDGEPVGMWAHFWTCRHRARRLAAHVVKSLEAIPGWNWILTLDDRRKRYLRALKKFLEEREFADLRHHRVVNGLDVYAWLCTQRSSYRAGRPQPAWLIKELESLPEFTWEPRHDK